MLFETDVIGQAQLAAKWYAEAREAFDAGDMERAVISAGILSLAAYMSG